MNTKISKNTFIQNSTKSISEFLPQLKQTCRSVMNCFIDSGMNLLDTLEFKSNYTYIFSFFIEDLECKRQYIKLRKDLDINASDYVDKLQACDMNGKQSAQNINAYLEWNIDTELQKIFIDICDKKKIKLK